MFNGIILNLKPVPGFDGAEILGNLEDFSQWYFLNASFRLGLFVSKVSTKTWNDLKPPKTTYNHLQPPTNIYNHLKNFNNHLQPPQKHLQPLANYLKQS